MSASCISNTPNRHRYISMNIVAGAVKHVYASSNLLLVVPVVVLLPVFGVSCADYFHFGLGCWKATFWEIAAHSVYHMFSVYFEYL